uniref:Calmodulin-lysine N-methyltransferase n=1 Tax=Coccolithus braarudii TaxID=221442 RepID=A0A7S0L1X7_9EUKA
MALLSAGQTNELLADLADEVLSLCLARNDDGALPLSNGLARSADLEELYHEELYPDTEIVLQRPMAGMPAAEPGASAATIIEMFALAARSRLECSECIAERVQQQEQRHRQSGEMYPPAADCRISETRVYLRCLSRRETFGAEIECKVWPASLLLARLLWSYPWLVGGRAVLELGAGVGLAALGAARAGAAKVLLTDINGKALKYARENVRKNGADAAAACRVAHLDWAEPPILSASAAAPDGAAPVRPSCPFDALAAEEGGRGGRCAEDGQDDLDGVDPSLLGSFDVLLGADIVNNDGLPALVYRMLTLYLSPRGHFLMLAPRPRHRHKVDELRAMLLASDTMEVRILVVPAWLSVGIEEAEDIVHELYVVSWRGGDE